MDIGLFFIENVRKHNVKKYINTISVVYIKTVIQTLFLLFPT